MDWVKVRPVSRSTLLWGVGSWKVKSLVAEFQALTRSKRFGYQTVG